MTDDLQLARARKHSPGYAAYLEARAKLDAETTAPPPEPTGLDALTERRPELAAAAEAIAAANPGLRQPDRGEVGTGAGGGGDPVQTEATLRVNRSVDCPEAPAQAHLPANPERPEQVPEAAESAAAEVEVSHG